MKKVFYVIAFVFILFLLYFLIEIIQGQTKAGNLYLGSCIFIIILFCIVYCKLKSLMEKYHKFEYETKSKPMNRYFGIFLITIIFESIYFYTLFYKQGNENFGSFNIAFMNICNQHDTLLSHSMSAFFMINFVF